MYTKIKKINKNSLLYSLWELLHKHSSNQYLRCFQFPQQYFHINQKTIFSHTDNSNFRIHSGAYYPKVLGNNFHQSPLISFSLHRTYAYVLSVT
jgi:hypothetical protein